MPDLAPALDEDGGRATTAPASVAYDTVGSPIGPLLLAATQEGLVRVAFEAEGFDEVLEDLAARIGPASREATAVIGQAERELAEYFTGERRTFEVPLDLRLSTDFRRTVQQFLSRIEYGRTLTYAQVADAVGNPRAVRAVGSACATNPLPIVVPCHRVLRSDGSTGGYLGGLGVKQRLLAAERDSLGGDHG